MKKLIIITILAFIACVPQSQGYTNPIDDQSTETINADLWDLVSTNLYVGSNTWGNTMIVTNVGVVQNTKGYIGYATNSFNNAVTVSGSGAVWSNSSILCVGYEGSDNSLSIMNGGRVEDTFGVLGSNITSSNNTVTVSGPGSVWNNSIALRLGNWGDRNKLIITDGGRVENINGFIGWDWGSWYNAATVDGTGSVWNNTGDLNIGNNGGGNKLTVSNGGRVENITGILGNDTGWNDATVSGSGSVWSNSAELYVGKKCNWNKLSITNGGAVQNTTGHIGYATNSLHNTVTVSGSGSVWSNAAELYVGYEGNDNSLSITNGGAVHNTTGHIGYATNSLNNAVTVSGPGSDWSNAAELCVGYEGNDNSLSITNGGAVQNTKGHIGYATNSFNNAVTVSGSGAVWSNSSILCVGYEGSDNSLSIMNGGRVEDTSGVLGESSTSSNNTVTVSGPGSVWNNSSGLRLGNEGGRNKLIITDGGRVENISGYIGSNWRSWFNAATVDGIGSVWSNAGDLKIGNAGGGSKLTVSNGGRVENITGILGNNVDWNRATVSGSGSVWSNSAELYVGKKCKGNKLFITNGGAVQNTTGHIGYATNSLNNAVTVSGSGSVWSNVAELYVGYEGNDNSLSITNGGRVENTEGFIGRYSGSSNNMVTVRGVGSVWRNSDALHVGESFEGIIDNNLMVFDGGLVAASSVTVYPINMVGLDSGGILAVSGGYTQQAGATLTLGINSATSYGRLTVGGAASLNGTLKIVLLGGFEPEVGSTFDLFGWYSISGSFTLDALPPLSFGRWWDDTDIYTTGELRVVYDARDTDLDGMPDGWELKKCGGNIEAGGNLDFDPHDNLSEYIAGSDPASSNSYFCITNAASVADGFVVKWDPCVTGRWYSVNWTNDLTGVFQPLETNIVFPQSSYTDTTYSVDGKGFYRVDVQLLK